MKLKFALAVSLSIPVCTAMEGYSAEGKNGTTDYVLKIQPINVSAIGAFLKENSGIGALLHSLPQLRADAYAKIDALLQEEFGTNLATLNQRIDLIKKELLAQYPDVMMALGQAYQGVSTAVATHGHDAYATTADIVTSHTTLAAHDAQALVEKHMKALTADLKNNISGHVKNTSQVVAATAKTHAENLYKGTATALKEGIAIIKKAIDPHLPTLSPEETARLDHLKQAASTNASEVIAVLKSTPRPEDSEAIKSSTKKLLSNGLALGKALLDATEKTAPHTEEATSHATPASSR